MILYHGTESEDDANAILQSGRFVPYLSTEGKGVYLSADPDQASFFGDIIIEADASPGRYLLVDEQPLYFLHENWIEQDIRLDDTEWGSLNRQALMDVHGCIPEHEFDYEGSELRLTELAEERGYDSFKIVSGGEVWWVIFDPARVRPLRILK